jgi:hypothetical protein
MTVKVDGFQIFDISLGVFSTSEAQLTSMDCVIPGHSVRPFCASISCLSRIGKDLYLEFDAIDGLALRTLNDAKSAYACFRFEPTFFERCTAPPLQSSSWRKRHHSTEEEETSPSQERFSCRVALRALAAVVRPRKSVVALRVRSETSSAALFLSFEFTLQNQDALISVVHRIKAADANAMHPVAPTDDASEIRGSPKILLQLLDPLKNTPEAALVVGSGSKTVSASSFHHTDTTTQQQQQGNTNNNNAILHAANASLLKTETAIGCDEFEEFDFHQNRNLRDDMVPEDVNQEVILVFPIKEAKSMLQFCSQAHLDQELCVSLFFHWGGKPLVFESTTDSFSARLVLATLDYKLLAPLRSSNEEN